MIDRQTGRRPRDRRGFTIVELMIAMVIGLIVLGAVYGLMITQSSGYGTQRELADVRETSRSGATLLSWDLRHAAAGGSGIVAMTPNSITIRAVRGVGIVCAKHPTLPRYGLWQTGGKIEATADDSALIFQIGRDKWQRAKLTGVGTPAALGVPACAWAGTRPPDAVVEIQATDKSDTISIKVGAPFRAFRLVQYAQYAVDGRWWLGRRVGATVGYEQLTGPLVSTNGLRFAYYDTLGASTSNPAAVGAVAYTLSPESHKKARRSAGDYAYQRDSLSTRVQLRR